MKVHIREPLGENNYLCVWDKYVLGSIKNKEMLEIETPEGTAIHDPIQVKAKWKKMSKVFRRPEEPMVLYCGYAKVASEEELVKLKYQRLFT